MLAAQHEPTPSPQPEPADDRRRRRKGRHHRVHRPPPGAPPGALVATPEAPAPRMHLIAYGPDELIERPLERLDELPSLGAGTAVVWIDVQGLGDLELIRAFGERFGLHPLALSDVAHVHQRPKLELYDDHLFAIARMARLEPELVTEQLSLFLGNGFVLTFQERPGDCFESVRTRIRQGAARLRGSGADYLAYALLDAVIDSCFPLLEHYGELVEGLEAVVVSAAEPGHINRIHTLKRDLLELRRAIWPLREVTAGLMRDETPFVQPATQLYLRDCADHIAQLIDMIEIDREVASGLIDLHLSSVSMRMNEIMKVLTVIATIFIPLSFVAGVYGMNFDPAVSPFNMPELDWYLGYPFALGLMAAMALGLLIWFRRKGWLGR